MEMVDGCKVEAEEPRQASESQETQAAGVEEEAPFLTAQVEGADLQIQGEAAAELEAIMVAERDQSELRGEGRDWVLVLAEEAEVGLQIVLGPVAHQMIS